MTPLPRSRRNFCRSCRPTNRGEIVQTESWYACHLKKKLDRGAIGSGRNRKGGVPRLAVIQDCGQNRDDSARNPATPRCELEPKGSQNLKCKTYSRILKAPFALRVPAGDFCVGDFNAILCAALCSEWAVLCVFVAIETFAPFFGGRRA